MTKELKEAFEANDQGIESLKHERAKTMGDCLEDMETRPEDIYAYYATILFCLGLAFLITVGWQLGRIAAALEQ